MKNKQEILGAVLARSALDWEFRQRLLSDPQVALAQGYGLALPPGFTIRFIERSRDVDALVVLPDFKAASENDELGDEALETVSGGDKPPPSW